MDGVSVILATLTLLFVVPPALTLTHEMGHALTTLALTGRGVEIVLGDPEKARRLPLNPPSGRLRLLGSPSALGPGGFVGSVRLVEGSWEDSWEEIPRLRRVMIFAAGPLATLLATALLAAVALASSPGDPGLAWPLPQGAALMGLWQLACTATPIRYPRSWGAYADLPSDGLTVLTLLREARAKTIERDTKR